MSSNLILLTIALICAGAALSTATALDWQARHGMTSDQYQQTFNDLMGQGYRLTDVSGYSVNGQAMYAAIWEKSNGPDWQARHGMTSDQYQQNFNDLMGQGYRLTDVSGYEVNGQDLYAAIWEKSNGPDWQARHGMTSDQYQQNFNDLMGQGYRLTDVSGYSLNGQAMYAAIWEMNDSTDWQARHGMTSDQYQQNFNDLMGQGYRLTDVSGYEVNGQDLYAAIWEKSNGPDWQARHGMTSDQYQQTFNDLMGQGYRLTDVSGYSLNGQAMYAAIWEMDNGSNTGGTGTSMGSTPVASPPSQGSNPAQNPPSMPPSGTSGSSNPAGNTPSMTCSNADADTPASQLSQEAAETAVLCLINEQRVANGVPALKFNQQLRDAARQQANDAKNIKWWAGGGNKIHTNPITGSTPQSRIKDVGYCPGEAAPPTNENGYDAYYKGGVQYQSGTTPRAAVTWWMNSPEHRATLLNPIYTESGVAVVLGVAEQGNDADQADGGAIFVETFGGCTS